jgi:hypothetical protein
MTRILIFLMAVLYLASLLLIKPVSEGGKLTRKLSIANAVGWIIIMPLPTTGHLPAYLIPLVLFWLINLVLLPSAAIALWMSYKEREERISYLAVTSAYIGMNFLILIIFPIVWAALEITRS